MSINKLILKTILMGALGVASVGLSSCDDDGGNSGPDIGENNAEASTTGDVELNLNAEGSPEVITKENTLTVAWRSDTGFVRITFPKKGTRSYDVPDDAMVNVGHLGSTWQGKGGSITIFTNDTGKVTGALNAIKLAEQNGDRTAKLFGEFNASKGERDNNGPIVRGQVNLQISGKENVTLSGFGATFQDTAFLDGSLLSINYQDDSGNTFNLSFIAVDDDTNLTPGIYKPRNPGNPNRKFIAAQFRINGSIYSSIEAGNVELISKSPTRVSAKVNDLEFSKGRFEKITVNGKVSAKPF